MKPTHGLQFPKTILSVRNLKEDSKPQTQIMKLSHGRLPSL